MTSLGRLRPRAMASGLRRRLRAEQEASPTSSEPGHQLSAPEQVLVDSPLFDEDWYALQTGRRRDRLAAVRHYLRKGSEAGFTPHPLVVTSFLASQIDEEYLDGRDPFVVYLRRRMWRKRPHPLFEAGRYTKRHPEALERPWGPLGHYLEVGAAAGAQTSRALPPDEDGRCPDTTAWVRERAAEWRGRADKIVSTWSPTYRTRQAASFAPRVDELRSTARAAATDEPLVTVVVNAGFSEEHLAAAIRSVEAQSLDSWEMVVVDRRGTVDVGAIAAREAGRPVALVSTTHERLPDGIAEALAGARGRYVAYLEAGDTWMPDRLAVVVGLAEHEGVDLVADDMSATRLGGEMVYAFHGVPGGSVISRKTVALGRMLVRRSLLERVGPVDRTVHAGWEHDLVARLCTTSELRRVPFLGSHRDFPGRGDSLRLRPGLRPLVDQMGVESWLDVALNRRLVDWTSLEGQTQQAGVVSVVIPTYDDWAMTTDAVESVMAAAEEDGIPVDCLVWDNGCGAATAVVLDALTLRFPDVRVLHSPVNHGFALGNNLAVAHARGEVVVFLNNDTTVSAGWLPPLIGALQDDETLGAQSLLLYPSGSVQSAGVAFPSTGGIPHAYLQGFPLEDAAGVGSLRFSALTGAAMALRFSDVVALRGFDPLFTNGMEDIDLCHRLETLRAGSFRVLPEVPVVHHESRTPGRYNRYMENRNLYLDRWAGVLEPRDDVEKWAAVGLRVVDHEIQRAADWQQRRLLLPMPVLVRRERLEVQERPRQLRWAIKNPAPFGPEAERWGDTHFARSLASALRECGQQVVIDHRPEFHRSTSRHDDVALLLHGLAPFKPSPEQVSLAWVISHPEMLGRPEASAYDRVLVASRSWAERIGADWGIPTEPLLQATDPALFDPDCAVPDTGHPVLFVGSSRKVYRRIVEDSVEAGLPLSLYGGLWEGFVPQRFIKGTYLPNADLGAAYRSAGVVLNDHWDDMREHGFVSNRLFDAVASGARVITDEIDGLEELFGRSAQVYRTREDLVRLSSLRDPDEVFGDDDERRAVAERVRREHSFRARAERLVEIAHETRKQRGFTV